MRMLIHSMSIVLILDAMYIYEEENSIIRTIKNFEHYFQTPVNISYVNLRTLQSKLAFDQF